MSAAIGFLHVGEHVARNPVARAVSAQRLHAAVRDSLLRMYLLAEGDDVSADCTAASKALSMAWLVLAARGNHAGDDARVIRSGIDTIEQLAHRGWVWRRSDAGAMDACLVAANDVLRAASAAETLEAWTRLDALERRSPTATQIA